MSAESLRPAASRARVEKPQGRLARMIALAHSVGAAATLNHIAAAVAVRRRPTRVASWPRFLQFEVSSRCNMACAQCSRSTLGPPQHQGHMSLSTFEKLLAHFRHFQHVTLHGLGEPLLNHDLAAMARAVKARAPMATIGLNTNGVLLTPARVAELVEAGLGEIGVSLDAATASTHQVVRGGRFDQIVHQVGAVCELSARPSVALALVVMEPNVGELVEFVELGAQLKVDRISFCDLSARWKPEGTDPMAVESIERARRMTLAAERRAAELNLPFVYTKLDRALWPEAFIPCFYLWDYPYVTWEGFLTPCCALPYAETAALGDLRSSSFKSIWNGPGYRAMRDGLSRGRIPELCRGCHHAAPGVVR
ncbi:radical SAM protein [Candidatus Fermentibacteria bacterium]|nr:radical SAM protein [Candidatus Fermentibacteria bacterium]